MRAAPLLIVLIFLLSRWAYAADSEALWKNLEASAGDSRNINAEIKKKLDLPIELEGWLIPDEFEKGELNSFLLSHYPKGCIHVPLPPPTSIIQVVMNAESKKLRDIKSSMKVLVKGKFSRVDRVDAEYKILADFVKEIPL